MHPQPPSGPDLPVLTQLRMSTPKAGVPIPIYRLENKHREAESFALGHTAGEGRAESRPHRGLIWSPYAWHHEILKGQQGETEVDQVPQTESGTHTCPQPRRPWLSALRLQMLQETRKRAKGGGWGPMRRKARASQESSEFPSPVTVANPTFLSLGHNLTRWIPDLRLPRG